MGEPLLQAEIWEDGKIYLTTVNRKHILELIEFCTKQYSKFEEREQRQITVLDWKGRDK